MPNSVPAESLRELIDLTADILTVVDEHGVIQYQSPSAERVAGYEQEELVGESVFEYIHPDDRAAGIEKFQETVEADSLDEAATFEFRFKHNDGSWMWLEARGTSRIASELDGYVMASRDVSERKEYEQQLKNERDRLDRFATMVSHDLRNPLNVAQLRLELASDECESDHLDEIEHAHQRMEDLIEDVRILARKGGPVTEFDSVDMRSLIENCWSNVETRGASVVVDVDRTVRADEDRVKHVFENLIRNAVEHGGEGVTVAVGEEENGVYFEDDGSGFTADDPDTVFDSGVSTKPDGSGFGLTIVKEIVDAHGWAIHATEGTDGGARFEITGLEGTE